MRTAPPIRRLAVRVRGPMRVSVRSRCRATAGFWWAASLGPFRALAIQSDGRILIGGAFASFDGAPVGFFARLNSDGSRDAIFRAGAAADAPVNALALDPQGRIFAVGAFSQFAGQSRRGFVR